MVGNKTRSRATVVEGHSLSWAGGERSKALRGDPLSSFPSRRRSPQPGAALLPPSAARPAAALRPFAAGPARSLRNKMADGSGASGAARSPTEMGFSTLCGAAPAAKCRFFLRTAGAHVECHARREAAGSRRYARPAPLGQKVSAELGRCLEWHRVGPQVGARAAFSRT